MNKTWLSIATIIVGCCCYISNATPVVTLASLSGIIYVVGVAYSWKHANAFGAVLSACLAYLSYHAGFFGNVGMNVFTLVISLYGWWHWSQNTINDQVIHNQLNRKAKQGLLIVLTLAITASMILSYALGSSLWYLDGITAILPIFATILLVGAYKEQWSYGWIPYNILEIIMWYVVSTNTPELLAILVMRIIFLINSIIGYKQWNQ